MKSHIINVKVIIDQYDDKDPVQYAKNVLNKVNQLIGDFDGIQPRIFTENITQANIETNLWDEEDDEVETPSLAELNDFFDDWGQTHDEICSCLGYDEEGSDDLLTDDYFWVQKRYLWCNKEASGFTERDKEIADYLRFS